MKGIFVEDGDSDIYGAYDHPYVLGWDESDHRRRYESSGFEMSDIRDYRVEHLLLLVGSNPLPNMVAGKLLIAPGGTISLIHSGNENIFKLAERLQKWFLLKEDPKEGPANVHLTEVDASNADSVRKNIQEQVLDKIKEGGTRVGLHYTGGTKVMSVQAYRLLEDWAKKHGGDAVFSYLDAQTLRMRFDPTTSAPAASFYVGRGVNVSILDLLKLHNWEPTKSPVEVPVLPRSAAALLAIHSNANDASIWTKWLHDELFANARRVVDVPRPFLVYKSKKVQPEDYEVLQSEDYEVKQPASDNNWKNKTDLRDIVITLPNLPMLKQAMSMELGQDAIEKLYLTWGKGASRCKNEQDFCDWLSGTWLESAVLSVLQNCSQELHLQECCMTIMPKVLGDSGNKQQFEFDVVAMRGYQFFAFACTTESENRGLLKHKLFEAYVRARQMGGDEACVALICCMGKQKAANLQAEICRDFSTKKRIRVFGREDLTNLDEYIKAWVREQSEED